MVEKTSWPEQVTLHHAGMGMARARMCAREFAIGIHPQFYWENRGNASNPV